MATVKPGKRLWLTADRSRLVEDGDPAASFLFCGADDEVDAASYQALIASRPRLAEPQKALEKPEDKARRRGGDK